ncbi:MAG: leucyl aminopeptidase [Negativicutes bacterium]
MIVEVKQSCVTKIECDALIVNIFEGVISPGGATGAVNTALDNVISQMAKINPDFGKFGKVHEIYTFGKIPAEKIIVIGMGKPEKLNSFKLRQLAGIGVRAARDGKAKIVATIVHGAGIGGFSTEVAAQATVEGSVLGEYIFDRFKTTKPQRVEKLFVVEYNEAKMDAFVAARNNALIATKAIMLARDLGNLPANYLNPAKMVELAREIAISCNLKIDVFGKTELEKMGAGGILAVGAGSANPPYLVVLEYCGDPESSERIALVGKGVMYDSGGLSLKTPTSMRLMKGDMSGAAACLAAIQAIAEYGWAVNLQVVLPLAENMPSGTAYKVDDILTMLNGKTVEVVNTDAEGRLILADALYYAKKSGVTGIIDIATLTGAASVALGDVAAIMTNNNKLCDTVKSAAAECNERVWELPMFDEYAEGLESTVADMTHCAGRGGGAITAAKFLEKFVDDIPWVHIDIGGAADIENPYGCLAAGCTGFGTRTLIRFAELRARKNSEAV